MKHKYNAKKTIVNGHTFASKKEAQRYHELVLMSKAGLICDLTLQPKFEIVPKIRWNGQTLRTRYYIADFQYYEALSGLTVVEDVKGMRLPLYKLKRHLFLLQYPFFKFVEI